MNESTHSEQSNALPRPALALIAALAALLLWTVPAPAQGRDAADAVALIDCLIERQCDCRADHTGDSGTDVRY